MSESSDPDVHTLTEPPRRPAAASARFLTSVVSRNAGLLVSTLSVGMLATFGGIALLAAEDIRSPWVFVGSSLAVTAAWIAGRFTWRIAGDEYVIVPVCVLTRGVLVLCAIGVVGCAVAAGGLAIGL